MLRDEEELFAELFTSPQWRQLRQALERQRDEWKERLTTVDPADPNEAFRALLVHNAMIAELSAMIEEPERYFAPPRKEGTE